jgi:hypothetical protein
MKINPRIILLDAGYDHETIKQFLIWHAANQWAWKWYDIEALKEAMAGVKRISSKHLFERMRIIFKREINNNYTSIFARIWAAKHPQYRHLFEFRVVTKARMENELEARALC